MQNGKVLNITTLEGINQSCPRYLRHEVTLREVRNVLGYKKMPEFPGSRHLKIKVLSSRECLEYIHVIAHGIITITLWCRCSYYFILMGQENMHRYLMQDFPRVSALMTVWFSGLIWIPFSIGLKYLFLSQGGLCMWFNNTIIEYIQIW